MTVTEQLDGLRALAIDPMRFLVVPRVVAMIVMLVALTVIGDLVALLGASVVGAHDARHRLVDDVLLVRRQPEAVRLPARHLQVDRVRRRDRDVVAATSASPCAAARSASAARSTPRSSRPPSRSCCSTSSSPTSPDELRVTHTDRTARRSPSLASRAPASSCGWSTSRRSPASCAAVARAAARPPAGELARQMYVDRQPLARVHRRDARLHRHGDDVPGVPPARRASPATTRRSAASSSA